MSKAALLNLYVVKHSHSGSGYLLEHVMYSGECQWTCTANSWSAENQGQEGQYGVININCSPDSLSCLGISGIGWKAQIFSAMELTAPVNSAKQ